MGTAGSKIVNYIEAGKDKLCSSDCLYYSDCTKTRRCCLALLSSLDMYSIFNELSEARVFSTLQRLKR